jgi:hypothetical protein
MTIAYILHKRDKLSTQQSEKIYIDEIKRSISPKVFCHIARRDYGILIGDLRNEVKRRTVSKIRRNNNNPAILESRILEKYMVDENDLTLAIHNATKMDVGDSKDIARHVMSVFGYENRTIDNRLEQDDRDVFYMLEDEGLLKTDREEAEKPDGVVWRIHYWCLNLIKIYKLAHPSTPKKKIPIDATTRLYNTIPADAWVRGNS